MMSLHSLYIMYFCLSDCLFFSVGIFFFMQTFLSIFISLNFKEKLAWWNQQMFKSTLFVFVTFLMFFAYKFYLNYFLNPTYTNLFFFNQTFSDVLILLSLLVSLISWIYLSERYIFQNTFLNTYLSVFFFCSVNMVYTTNVLTMFIFFEFIFIPSVFFAYKLSYVQKSEKAVEFLVVWTLSGAVVSLIGFAMLFYICGTVNLPCLYAFSFSYVEKIYLFSFFFLGFGAKLPIWPLYFWLTKVHVEAPTGFSMFLSGFLVKTAFFCFSQVYFLFFTPVTFAMALAVIVVGVLDASFRMWTIVDIKKLMAMATIQEMNMLVLFLILLVNSNFTILNLFLLVHGILSIFMFYLVELVYKLYQTRSVINIQNAQMMTRLHTLVWMSLLTYRGFPGLVKFLVEWELFSTLWTHFSLFGFVLFLCISFFGVVGFSKNWFLVLYGAYKKTPLAFVLKKKDVVVGNLFIYLLMFLNSVMFLF